LLFLFSLFICPKYDNTEQRKQTVGGVSKVSDNCCST